MNEMYDLKIVGIDNTRPPKLRKEPYIDLVFTLSEKAGTEWCREFNALFENGDYSVKAGTIDDASIETWVRDMEEIPGHLEMLKAKAAECNERLNERRRAAARVADDKNTALAGEQGAQGRLNEIIAGLEFD
jgi:hypothetical protein